MPLTPESEALWREAFAALPLYAPHGGRSLASELGDRWSKSGDPCPSCAKKHKFKFFERGNRWFFKCFSDQCDFHAPEGPRDEIGYLAIRRGLSRKDAAREYLRLALPGRIADFQKVTSDSSGTFTPPAEIDRPDAENIPSTCPPHAVWKRLILTQADFAKLQNKRGFSPELISLCGFRSNNEGNYERLADLTEEYPLDVLLAEGVYERRFQQEPKLCDQLLGLGLTNEKSPVTKKRIWKHTEPVLIPYFDPGGNLHYLRPHKGGLLRARNPLEDLDLEFDEDEDPDDEEKDCHSYVYIPPGTGRLIAENEGLCILTEGEFKAAACRQARVPALACPGISFVKNPTFRRHLLATLEELGVQHLVIIYDNEAKDDPQFANFKPKPRDRIHTQVWAEYAQIILEPHLKRVGGSCKVGWLPDEYRQEGKADFDGILAQLVWKDGLEKGTAKARRVFLQAIDHATSDGSFLGLFPTPQQKLIRWGVRQKLYTRKLLVGGRKESDLAIKYHRLSAEPIDDDDTSGEKPIDRELAKAFRETLGCYYTRAAVSDKERGRINRLLEKLRERLAGVHAEVKDPENPRLRDLLAKKDALFDRKRGLPERVSTFTLRCVYRLHGTDGFITLLVRRETDSKDLKHRDDTLYTLTKDDLNSLQNFREWLAAHGLGQWHGRISDFEFMKEDLDHDAYLSDIYAVPRLGLHRGTGIWFFGETAYAPDGTEILPDDLGIYWHDGCGYRLETSEIDQSGLGSGITSFAQGLPFLNRPAGGAKPLTNGDLEARGGVRGIFKTIAEDIFDNVGGYDGWLALGLMLSYAVAPEMVKRGGHPAPFIFGELGEGKSTLMRWLMRLWGFPHLEGISLSKGLTSVGMERILEKHSCIPVFIDEARRENLDDARLSVLRNAPQRQASVKGTMEQNSSVRLVAPQTTPLVGGQASIHDAATRSRYAQINIAKNRRIGDAGARYERIVAECEHYHLIGRWLMLNRPSFVEHTLSILDAWESSPSVRACIPDDRPRTVHGLAYASMVAACRLLDLPETSEEPQFFPSPEAREVDHRPRRITEFYTFLLTYGGKAQQDVRDETFLAKFWDDICYGIGKGIIHSKFLFTAILTRRPGKEYSVIKAPRYKPIAPGSQRALLISIKHVFPAYEKIHRELRGCAPPLTEGDIRRSLERKPYWISSEGGHAHHRPKIEGKRHDCWALSLAAPDGSVVDGTSEVDEDGDEYAWPEATAILDALSEREGAPPSDPD